MRLHVTFYDVLGVKVESFSAEAEEAARRTGEFMRLHGTDPDGGGDGASAGTVFFCPAWEPKKEDQ